MLKSSNYNVEYILGNERVDHICIYARDKIVNFTHISLFLSETIVIIIPIS